MKVNFSPINLYNNFNRFQPKASKVSFSSNDDDIESDEFVKTLSKEIADSIRTIMSKMRDEIQTGQYIIALSDKNIRTNLNKIKNTSITDFNAKILNHKPAFQKYINELMISSGITNVWQLSNFLRIFNQSQKTINEFDGENIGAIKIFGYLKNKSDINLYPATLLYLFNEQDFSQNPDFESLNDYIEILKKSNVQNEDEFDEKLSYLKPEFNNFEADSDKLNALDYLKDTYDEKIRLIDEIIKSNPDIKIKDSEKIYFAISDVVNYLYLQNNGKNLENLQNYIDIALNFKKIKSSSKNLATKYFGDLDDPQNKIALYELLKECDATIDDINMFTRPTYIADNNMFDAIINKTPISNYIKEKQSSVSYNNFCSLLTSVYTKGENKEDTLALDTLLSVIESNNIKDQNAFLTFYNNISNKKEKTLSTKQICDFIDLFRYSDNKKINNIATLKKNKENFLKALPNIEDFLLNDANEYFVGKLPLEIYKEFSYCVDFSSYEKIKTLNDMAQLSHNNTKESQTRQQNFEDFKYYIGSKPDTINFLIQNEISFDDSNESLAYKNNCLEILNILSTDPKKAKKRIKQLNNSGFLLKSKNNLDSFMNQFKRSNQSDKMIEFIADKKIQSIKVLNNFIKKYSNSSNRYDNLIEHLFLIPDDMDFETYTNILKTLNDCLKFYQIPKGIDNDNILNIDISKYVDRDLKNVNTVNELISSALNVKDEKNFVTGLKSAFVEIDDNKDELNRYSVYNIARELADKIGKSDESYSNIARELKLDKDSLNIPQNCDYNTYVYAIAEKLPNEFIDFVNSNDWLKITSDDKKIANVPLHARLRLIDRTVLSKSDNIEILYSDETKEKLKEILKSIYFQSPCTIKPMRGINRIVIYTPYENRKMESVFSNNGELITVVPTD